MRLAIELNGVPVGSIDGDERTFEFHATPQAIGAFGLNSTALSVSIPLVRVAPRHHANRRRNWFRELLPEGVHYDFLLAQAGLRRGDTLAFLARYGRDVAGALQIWDTDDPTEPPTPGLRELDDAEVRELLDNPTSFPLANADARGRSSLAGVQPKIVLHRTAHGWAQAFGGHPTTHILKPQLTDDLSTVIFDEEYGQRLARALDLCSFDAQIQRFDGRAALVIERFDRSDDGGRVHQEDMSQVLGASGNEKYQEIGGVVSLRRVADVLQRHSGTHDLRRLAELTVFATAIGNLDMHTKNISLLHPSPDEIRLAPAYDQVPQGRRPSDGRVALAVNRTYRHAALTAADLRAELASWPVRRPEAVVHDTLERLADAIAHEVPLAGASAGLDELLRTSVSNLLDGSPIGEPDGA